MGSYRKVLVAVDLSAEAGQVFARARAVAQQGASFVLVHVVEPMISESPYELAPTMGMELEQHMIERSQKFLQELAQQAPDAQCVARVKLGSIKGVLLDTARQEQVDLVVIGTHGRHGLGILLGSTANAVLHGTPCDVLAVRVGAGAA